MDSGYYGQRGNRDTMKRVKSRMLGFLAPLLPLATTIGAPVGLEVGQPFPDLLLPALDGGRPTSLADFKGKPVVLHLFASW